MKRSPQSRSSLKDARMRPFKFVRTADLHLDSPFVGISRLDDSVANRLREATFHTFERMLDICIDQRVDFLLIAGDVYNSRDRSLRAQIRFRDGLARLSDAGISAFVVHGNHDPLDSWSASLRWPERVHIFGGREVERVVVGENGDVFAQIYGISYPTRDVRRNLAREFRRVDDGPFAIGLLHCNLGDSTGHEPYAPCTVEDLVSVGMDYWALGHVHDRAIVCPEGPAIAYPGNPQGCNVREQKARGCYLVQVDTEGHPSIDFVAVDTIRWFWESVSIEQASSEEELIDTVENLCAVVQDQADNRPALCRVTLEGRSPMHRKLMQSGFVDDLVRVIRESEGDRDPSVWLERIEVDTRPVVDVEARRSGQDFLSDLLALIREYRDDPTLLSSLRSELVPLFESRRGRLFVEPLTDAELLQCLDVAEARCLDLLAGDD